MGGVGGKLNRYSNEQGLLNGSHIVLLCSIMMMMMLLEVVKCLLS